jgi:hypothetical protein
MINAVLTNPNNPRQPMLEKAILQIAVALVASLLASPIDRALAGQPTVGEWKPNGEGETEMTSAFTNRDKIRKPGVEELAETARGCLSNAGSAAALAASLSAFVISIDAFANEPTSRVILGDAATYQALARSVDDPGGVTYQNSATRVPQATSFVFNNNSSASIPFLSR